MKKVKTVKKRINKKQTKKLTPQQRFDKQWRLVQKKIQRNKELKEELDDFVHHVKQTISEDEQRLANILFFQTKTLIGFFSRKSLAQWQRDELGLWIAENIEHIQANPFSGHLNCQHLIDDFIHWQKKYHPEIFEHLDAILNDADMDDLDDEANFGNEEDLSKQDDDSLNGEQQGNLFDDVDEDPHNRAQMDEDTAKEDDDFFDDFFDDSNDDFIFEKLRQEQIKQQEMGQLLKKSSINKMFRKVASVIHPDKEIDPVKKEQKHHIMSALIEAREKKNITTIFALYSEHVGKSPLDLIDGDIENTLKLLKYQLEILDEELHQSLSESPEAYAIYNRFYAKSQKVVDKKIKQHLESVNAAILDEETLSEDLTSLKRLKPYLQARNEESRFSMPDSMFL